MADRLIWLVAAALFTAHAAAEELPDPTRPPAGIVAPAAAGGAAAPASAGLQSIIISKNRRAAIIDGETVELGGKHGDAKLIEVNEGGVILQGAQGRRVMTLFPDVNMTTPGTPDRNELKNDHQLKTKPQSPKNKSRPEGRKAGQAATGDGK